MASQHITFDSIPSGIRKPGKYFEYNTKLAVRTLPANDQHVLIVGQRTADGTVPALTPTDVYSSDQAALYFGAGSYVALTVIAVDDAAAGQPAKGSVDFTGTAAADGAFALYVGKTRVDISTYAGDTGTAIAARMADQVKQAVALPVTAAAVSGTLTLTAKNKGEAGNSILLLQLNKTNGVTATIAPMAGGLNDPDIGPALASVYGAKYDLYATCWTTQASLIQLRTHLDSISGPLEQRPAIGVAGTSDTLASAATLAGKLNAGRLTLGWHPGSVCLPAEIAAAYSAVIASETDPARPLNTLALSSLDVTPIASQPGRGEQEKALHNGVTPFEIGPGDTVQIVRSITTYTEDAQGIDDPALLDITTIRSLDYARKAWLQRIALRFPREKLSEKTPPKVRSELLDVAYKLEELEILENVDKWKGNLIVERDLQDANQLDAALPADVVNGLHVFAGRIDLIL
ncbi:hypothetical protein DFQ30_011436 [Apophysomyces sp. BC1015]|nr:hypothetical protein DFQ30_011436 [Apophysomyces sp. BC1015]